MRATNALFLGVLVCTVLFGSSTRASPLAACTTCPCTPRCSFGSRCEVTSCSPCATKCVSIPRAAADAAAAAVGGAWNASIAPAWGALMLGGAPLAGLRGGILPPIATPSGGLSMGSAPLPGALLRGRLLRAAAPGGGGSASGSSSSSSGRQPNIV